MIKVNKCLLFFFSLIIGFINIQLVLAKDRPALENYQSNHDSTKKTIKVAAAQILTYPDSISKNLGKILINIREAKEQGCEIILFQEGCLTGYPNDQEIQHIDFQEVGRAESQIRDIVKELRISVLLGSTSKENENFNNDVLVINENGQVLGRYVKTWRAGEPHYVAGSGPVIFTVAGVEATVIICHDLRYPELVRLGVAAGAQIVFIANNESGITAEHKLLGYRSMQISRATENYVYSVMANSPADPKNISRGNCSHGNSKIVDVMGNIIDEAGVFEESLVMGVLDLTKATREIVLRTMGESKKSKDQYGIMCEHPEYSAWIHEGLKLVKRLDGTGPIQEHLRD
jgi:omega-amidase